MLFLVPSPRSVRVHSGVFSPQRPVHVLIPDSSEPALKKVLFALATELRSAARQPVHLTHRIHAATIMPVLLKNTVSEAYRLVVKPTTIEIIGQGTAGLFYGVQTLRQLVRQHGMRVPCCVIEDNPAFHHRGVLLDVSRGRVPRLQTLCQWADLFAYLKINEIQLYVEHVFAFSFDPSISQGCDALTPHELRTFSEYCRARHILLIPCLACFGHMGRILSLPQYRDLAEVPWQASDWEHSRWVQRLRGATIDPRHPRTRALLRNMLTEFLPLFTAPCFNMCGDETYDLGKGRNRDWVRDHTAASLYARHVQFLHSEAERHGKRLMLWGDMLLKHPEAMRLIPRDTIVLDWGYEPEMNFAKTRLFIEADLSAYVCPSTRGYRVVFNEVEKARANVAGYARSGIRLGAEGLLITDWGDMGHFNLPAASLHGLALGANLAWNPRADAGSDFDRAFALQLFGDSSGRVESAFRRAGTTAVAAWPLLLTDVPQDMDVSPTAAENAAEIADRARAAFEACAGESGMSILPELSSCELSLACQALALTATKLRWCRQNGTFKAKRHHYLAEQMMTFFEQYAAAWRKGYKLLGLKDLRKAFAKGSARLLGKSPPISRNDLP